MALARHLTWLEQEQDRLARQIDSVRRTIGLGELYVADPRFAVNYGGEAGAAYVRDALRSYAENHL